jgi:hypothetical protein
MPWDLSVVSTYYLSIVGIAVRRKVTCHSSARVGGVCSDVYTDHAGHLSCPVLFHQGRLGAHSIPLANTLSHALSLTLCHMLTHALSLNSLALSLSHTPSLSLSLGCCVGTPGCAVWVRCVVRRPRGPLRARQSSARHSHGPAHGQGAPPGPAPPGPLPGQTLTRVEYSYSTTWATLWFFTCYRFDRLLFERV